MMPNRPAVDPVTATEPFETVTVPAGAVSRLIGVHFERSSVEPVKPSYRVLRWLPIVSVSSERSWTRSAHAPFCSSEAHSIIWPVAVGWSTPVVAPASTLITLPLTTAAWARDGPAAGITAAAANAAHSTAILRRTRGRCSGEA